jgi:hypothetical protein
MGETKSVTASWSPEAEMEGCGGALFVRGLKLVLLAAGVDRRRPGLAFDMESLCWRLPEALV